MKRNRTKNIKSLFGIGAIAGLAGGLAEVAWISSLAAGGGTPVVEVARGITAAITPSLAATSTGILLGLIIHLSLAMALGVVMLMLWRGLLREHVSSWWGASLALATLTTVWAVNFHVILPVLSPGFLGLVPTGLGLASKLLFALAFLAALHVGRRHEKEVNLSPVYLEGDQDVHQ